MVKGIYLAKISFTDKSGAKVRPILLIQKNIFDDYIFLPLTTNLKIKGLVLEEKDIEMGSLSEKSVVVTEKISIISPSLLLRKIAIVKESFYIRVIDDVCEFIRKK